MRRLPSSRVSTSAARCKGRVCLTAGVGGMGGAQPLAITMNEGIALVVDVDRSRLERRRDLRYLDLVVDSREAALREVRTRARCGRRDFDRLRRQCGNRVRANCIADGFRPDAVTDQTSAHDLINGYVPEGLTLDEAAALRATLARRVRTPRARELRQTRRSDGRSFMDAGSVVFDYGNNLRAQAQRAGYARAFDFPGFVPAFIRPLFCKGSGPFRFAALSGDPSRYRSPRPRIARAVSQ